MPRGPAARPPRKWVLVAAFWLAQAVVLFGAMAAWMAAWPSGDGRAWGWEFGGWVALMADGEFAAFTAMFLAGLMVAQAVFLWPVRRPAPSAKRGVSVYLSLAVAGLAIALLAIGVAGALHDAYWLWTDYHILDHAARGEWVVLGALVFGWAVATPLLVGFCRRGPRETMLGRLSARLFLGTLIEAAAVIPLDVMVRRRTDCYCGMGTFWALTICGAVGTFVLGPAVFLPLLAKRRRRWYESRCDACGYDMTGNLAAERCPECGAGWRS